jgi:hypothetical protein
MEEIIKQATIKLPEVLVEEEQHKTTVVYDGHFG